MKTLRLLLLVLLLIQGVLNFYDPTIILQVGGSFTSTVKKSKVFHRANVQEFKHPKQNNYILNLGLEINW